MEVGGQLHVPAALPQGKRLWYPLERRMDGPHSWSGQSNFCVVNYYYKPYRNNNNNININNNNNSNINDHDDDDNNSVHLFV
jgi:hypothetical protein